MKNQNTHINFFQNVHQKTKVITVLLTIYTLCHIPKIRTKTRCTFPTKHFNTCTYQNTDLKHFSAEHDSLITAIKSLRRYVKT